MLPTDDPTRRAVVHHTGSHYVNAHSKAFKQGDKVKGMVARHSHQVREYLFTIYSRSLDIFDGFYMFLY